MPSRSRFFGYCRYRPTVLSEGRWVLWIDQHIIGRSKNYWSPAYPTDKFEGCRFTSFTHFSHVPSFLPHETNFARNAQLRHSKNDLKPCHLYENTKWVRFRKLFNNIPNGFQLSTSWLDSYYSKAVQKKEVWFCFHGTRNNLSITSILLLSFEGLCTQIHLYSITAYCTCSILYIDFVGIHQKFFTTHQGCDLHRIYQGISGYTRLLRHDLDPAYSRISLTLHSLNNSMPEFDSLIAFSQCTAVTTTSNRSLEATPTFLLVTYAFNIINV